MPKGNKPRYREATRELLAFRRLTEGEDGAGEGVPESPARRGGRGDVPVRGFRLRDDRETETPNHTGSASAVQVALELAAMFPQVEAEVLEEVAAAVGGQIEAAVEALIGMGCDGGAGEGQPLLQGPGAGEHARDEEGPVKQEATKGPCTHVSEPTEGYGGRWGALPQECKLLILGELTMKDLARAARTCWELAAHARSAFANRRAISIPPGLSFPQMQGMCAAHVSALRVSLHPCRHQLANPYDFQRAFDAIAGGTKGRLEALDMRSCNIGDTDVAAILRALPGLKELNLSGCSNLTDESLKLIGRHSAATAEKLHELEREENGPWATEHGMRLQQPIGDITGFDFSRPGRSNANLIQRRMAAVAVHDKEQRLASQNPKMPPSGFHTLSLAGLENITDAGAAALLRGPAASKSLTSVDFSKCPNLTEAAMALTSKTRLRSLGAGSCQALRTLRLHLPGGSSLLELSVPGCPNLESLDLSAPELQSLNAANCKSLAALSCEAPRLVRLSLSLCRRLRDAGLELACPALRDVNVNQCTALTSAGVERIVGSAAHLEVLITNGCALISRLLLTSHARLKTLDVSGCQSLVTLRSNSRSLTKLAASGCTSLRNLELVTPYMEELDLTNTSVSADLSRHLKALLEATNPSGPSVPND